ncbi:hypothetical protein CSIM01_01535 [Colletotrichum simmondsii]|uniref:Uncharacterized protein n=1 Tax=Colletotrichum simmondsii TaxID=703756 RepID=A0A135TR80_9PEZI|nr:hypothetical protein CSIM01_01535 [Colletotrichum simmondsii]
MRRIEGQGDEVAKVAKRLLLWMIYAEKKLTAIQLYHAVFQGWRHGRQPSEQQISERLDEMICSCVGLVQWEQDKTFLSLVNPTTRAYLETYMGLCFPGAHDEITDMLMTYLISNAFTPKSWNTNDLFRHLKLNPLYGYAATNWGNHARRCSSLSKHSIMEFLSHTSASPGCAQALLVFHPFTRDSASKKDHVIEITPIHISAWFGIEHALPVLLQDPQRPISKFIYTPLVLAAMNGHSRILPILFEHQKNLEVESDDLGMALRFAAHYGHADVVRTLLRAGASPEAQDDNKRTPLILATYEDQSSIVTLLIEAGANLEAKDESGKTALSISVLRGHTEIPRILINAGADTEATDESDQTPLDYANKNRMNVDNLLLLHAHTPASGKKEKYLRDMVRHTMMTGQHNSLVRLLEAGAPIELARGDRQGPLQVASWLGCWECVEILLGYEANIEAQTNGYSPPIMQALFKDHKPIIQLLLKKGADIEVLYMSQTPLLWSVSSGQRDIAELLLDFGADIGAKYASGESALERARRNNDRQMVELLEYRQIWDQS